MRALAMGLRPIVFINKVDRPHANPMSALNQTFDLFIELEPQKSSWILPVLYGSGLDGWAVRDLNKYAHEGMKHLFETIAEYVPVKGEPTCSLSHAGKYPCVE